MFWYRVKYFILSFIICESLFALSCKVQQFLQQRLEILKIHTKTWDPKVSDGILQKVAAQTARFSGADLKSVCHDAAMIAVRDSAKTQSLTLDNVANLKETSKIQVLDVHFFKVSCF